MLLIILTLFLLSTSLPESFHQSGIRSIEGRISAPLNAFLPPDAVVVLMDRTESILARQPDGIVPETSQVAGELLLADEGTDFRIDLPLLATDSMGVFTVEIAQNYVGGPTLHPLEQRTEQGVIAWRSIITSETQPDILGGTLLVYAPEDGMNFPRGKGADGLLFTGDDPQTLLPAGFSLVDIAEPAFRIHQAGTASVTLYPIDGLLPIDLRELSYVDAFDRLFDLLRARYAYTDLYGVNWHALHDSYRTAIIEGEPINYYWLLSEMASQIPDRHIAAAPEPALVELMNPGLELSAPPPAQPEAVTTEKRNDYAIARITAFTGGRHTLDLWQDFISEARSDEVSGIIIDLSEARGGDGALATIMAAYLFSASEPMSFEDFLLSRFDSSLGRFSPVSLPSDGLYAPDQGHQFDGPVVVLISDACVSACELFTYLLRDRALIAGSGPTAGAGGAVNVVRMPGDISFFYTFMRAENRFGEPAWEMRGISPEITINSNALSDSALMALLEAS